MNIDLMQKEFESWWNGRGLPEGLKPAFYMVWQSAVAAAIAAQAQQPTVTDEMIAAAESVEDLYRRGTPETWKKVFLAMWREMPLSAQAQQPSEAKPYGYVTTLRNGTKHFYESTPYLDNAVKCDAVYLQAQAQQPEYTFDQLTKLTMQAATKEGHKVTMKIKWAQQPAPEGENKALPPHQTEQWKAVPFSTSPAPEGGE